MFDYTYQRLRYTVTYLLERGVPVAELRGGSGADKHPSWERDNTVRANRRVTVDLTLRFPRSDGSVGWIATVILIPEGQLPQRPAKYLEQDAILDRSTWSVLARFDPPLNSVPTGAIYDVWINTGTEKRRIGKVDLQNVSGDISIAIDAKTQERLSGR